MASPFSPVLSLPLDFLPRTLTYAPCPPGPLCAPSFAPPSTSPSRSSSRKSAGSAWPLKTRCLSAASRTAPNPSPPSASAPASSSYSPSSAKAYSSASTRSSPHLSAPAAVKTGRRARSEEHTSELQSLRHLVCRLLLEKKNHPPGDCPLRKIHHKVTGHLLHRAAITAHSAHTLILANPAHSSESI